MTEFSSLLVLYKFPLVELDCSDPTRSLTSAGFGPSETIILEPRGQSHELKRGTSAPPVPATTVFLQEIPDDNSCLFNAIGFVLEKQSLNRAPELRNSTLHKPA